MVCLFYRMICTRLLGRVSIYPLDLALCFGSMVSPPAQEFLRIWQSLGEPGNILFDSVRVLQYGGVEFYSVGADDVDSAVKDDDCWPSAHAVVKSA